MGFLDERAGLAGKAAIILGGGGGLGRAIADDLAAAGVGLTLADRNETLLADAVAHAASCGSRVASTVGDVRDDDVIDRTFDLADETFGRLDVLVNVVGGTFRQPFAESSPRGWDALIRTNFTWLLRPTQLAIARMRAGGRGGSIINLTSIEAHRAAPNFAVYAGMKAGVENWGRSLAVEFAPEGIRVNTIAADMVPTEGIVAAAEGRGEASPWSEGELDAQRTQIAIPMGRRGRYEDVGNCALFLASDLSTYVTGTSMHPDGGVLASSGWFHWPDAGFTNIPPPAVVSRAESSSERTTRRGEPSESSSERTTWRGEPSESSSERTTWRGEPSESSSERTMWRGEPSESSSERTTWRGEPSESSSERTTGGGERSESSSEGAGDVIEFAVYIPQFQLSYPQIEERVLAAEAAGFHSVWFMDHLEAPRAADVGTFEAFTLASALAARTTSIRFGFLTLCNQFRPPALLAKIAATFDVISGGRLDLGIGWGSFAEEFARFGIADDPPKVRAAKLAETLEILQLLFTGERVSYDGTWFQLREARALPTPVQEKIPIHVGGVGAQLTLPIVRRFADWWNVPSYGADRLDELRPAAGDGVRISLQRPIGLVLDPGERADVERVLLRRFGFWGGHSFGDPDEVAADLCRVRGPRRRALHHAVLGPRHPDLAGRVRPRGRPAGPRPPSGDRQRFRAARIRSALARNSAEQMNPAWRSTHAAR